MTSRTIKTVRLKEIHRQGAISEREEVHRKAFTKWLNSHLSKADPPTRVVDLISDLSDGKMWLILFDVLLNTKTERDTGHSHFHNMYNLQKVLDICQKNEIKIDGINASDIAEGTTKTILGLLWNIIVHFQLKETLKTDSKDYSIEKTLQSWCLSKLEKYKEFVQFNDFSVSWRDGKAFNAVLHSYKPDLFDFSHIMRMDNTSRLEHAFTMAALEWNVPRLLEPVDVDIDKPDKKMITMYLTCLYERLEANDRSRDTALDQSRREDTHQYVTYDDKVTRKPKAFCLRKSSSSSDKSDKSSQSDTPDFPRVFIEEKKAIQLSSVSSDISSSSSSAEPPSPTSMSLLEPHGEIVDNVTTIVDAPPSSPLLSRRFKTSESSSLTSRDTKVDSTTISNDTVIGVQSTTIEGTTTSTTSTTRRILQEGTEGVSTVKGEGLAETTTTTTVIETYLVQMSGEPNKKTAIEDKISSECETILEMAEAGSLEKSIPTKEDQGKTLEDDLTEVTIALSDLKPRVKSRDSVVDVKALINERERLQFKINQVLITGRKMVLDKDLGADKEDKMIERMDKLERRMKLLMLWPIRDLRSISNYDKLLDDKLRLIEAAVFHLEPKIKKSVITRDIKALEKERADIELKTIVVLNLGRDLINDKQIDRDKEKDFVKRMNDLEARTQLIVMWPIGELNKLAFSSTSNYSTFLKEKLEKAENMVSHLEPRVKKSYINNDNTDLIEERSKLKVIVQVATGLGYSMIEQRLLDRKEKKDFSQRIEKLEQRTNALMAWPVRETNSVSSNSRFLGEKLNEVEMDVENFEPRIKKAEIFNDNSDLIQERKDLKLKAKIIIDLGREMSEGKFIDRTKEASFLNRIDRLEKKMTEIMEIALSLEEQNGDFNHNMFLEKTLEEMDDAVTKMGQRQRGSFNSNDNTALTKERESLEVQVYGVINLGRGMMEDNKIDKEKENYLREKMDKLENKTKLMMKWPIRGSTSSGDRQKFIDELLKDVESEVTTFEPRIRRKDLSADDIKELNIERDKLEVKVYGVVNLGRAMIEDNLIDKIKEKHYQQRMDVVDRKMKMLMSWPIRKFSGSQNYDKYFEDMLKEVEKSVADIEPRVKKSHSNKDNKSLLEERKELEVKVYGTATLGRAMKEDLLFSSEKDEEFQQRIKNLEFKMKMLMMWPIKETTSSQNYDKYFEEKLKAVEERVADIETRIEKSHGDNETKSLLEELKGLEVMVHGTATLGRAMKEDLLFSSEKDEEFQQRIDKLEHKMKMLVLWPIKNAGRSKRCQELDDSLRKMEITVSEFEQRVKVKDRESVDLKSAKESVDEIKTLIFERNQIELDVFGVLNDGRKTMAEEDVDPIDRDFYERRMDRLEERARFLSEWLQNELQRLFNIYIILIKQHLERLNDWLIRAEVKMDLEDDIAPTRDAVLKQYKEHLEFHKEVGAYSTINMILEIDIDDPVIDEGLRQDIKVVSERWAAVWNWSEERKKRLFDVLDDWKKFRDEEKQLFDWLSDKEDAMKLIETTDISDGEDVKSHRNLLKSIIQDMTMQKYLLHVFQESGEILIAHAQYHNETAKPIRDEMCDFEECWRATLERAKSRKAELKESRQTFLEMADIKKGIKEWLNEAEILLAAANEERDEQEDEKYQDKIRLKCEERDIKQENMNKINNLVKELTPSIEKESADDINHVVKPLNRRWQDMSDKLDQCKEKERPFFHEECCLVTYVKNGLKELREKEFHFK